MEGEKLSIYDQCEGSLQATAIFDALGLPVENLDPEQIAKDFPTAAHEYLRCPPTHLFAYEGHFPRRWSDDLQLSAAVQQAVIEGDGDINMTIIAQKHVDAAEESILGWGPSTTHSTHRLATNGLNYKTSGQEGKAGNGVIIKMVPLALAMHYNPDFASDQRRRLDIIEDFTYMTHRSVIALVCSAVHANMLEEILDRNARHMDSNEDRRAFILKALDHAKKFEAEFGETEGQLSQRFQALLDNFEKLRNDSILLEISNGGKFFVPDTLTVCYGLLASDFSFQSAHRAVMMGGDADSNASIVGSTVALKRTITGIAPNLREQVWRKEELQSISRNFAGVLAKRAKK